MNHLQKVLLNILSDIDELMREYNVRYFLDGGSALGAIRHHGFIPWDDDIDIIVLPEDKEKFNFVCRNFLDKQKYTFVEAHKDWPFFMSKIKLNGTKIEEIDAYPEENQGIFIDVFYFDYARKSQIGKFWQFLCGRLFVSMLLTYKPYTTTSILKKIAISSARIFRLKPLKRWLFIQVRGQKKSSELSAVWDRTRFKWSNYFVPTTFFDEVKYVEFENTKFPVCKEYHKYLTKMYGDYMKLPPENERCALHALNVDFGKY